MQAHTGSRVCDSKTVCCWCVCVQAAHDRLTSQTLQNTQQQQTQHPTNRLYQPGDLLVRPTGGAGAAVFKGERFGRANTYVISTPFRLEAAPSVHGVSHAVATYAPAPSDHGDGRRLAVTFAAMRLEPAPATAADAALMAEWRAALAEANPAMDAETGVLEVEIPAGAMPAGWMDYLAMTPRFQLVVGNGGSTTLLERV